ncbi:cilia- and flagella-associated protein 91-like [Euwallacea similis]|uniref:cilia- and flagella-associated protein 91-like n=1 Tax=Euwallacea similis TaxID=1736056 RepID=UPI00344C8D3F
MSLKECIDIRAQMSSMNFQLCPIFSNMFSDLPSHPQVQLIQRRQRPNISHGRKLKSTKNGDPTGPKSVDVGGADRAKFFCQVINLPANDFIVLTNNMPRFTVERADKKCEEGDAHSVFEDGKTKNKQIQTLYRESSTQTIPWEPPYKIIGDGEPEVLKLDFLDWAEGLPAGAHEIHLIERARMKRSWENVVKPDINDENSLQRFRGYIGALERDELAFRENEIQEIQQLRLHLLKKMLEEIHEVSHNRIQAKLTRIAVAKETQKLSKLARIRKDAVRELRKLELKENAVNRRYQQPGIIEEHIFKASELYGPVMKNGEHTRCWHQIIDEKVHRRNAQFIDVEQFNTLPRWLDRATTLKETEGKLTSRKPQLCIRESKWTAPVLKRLYEELQDLRS